MCMMHHASPADTVPGQVPVLSGIKATGWGATSLCKDIPPMTIDTEEPVRRRRVWEIDTLFKCPIVGLCIDQEEQKQILKKTGHFSKDNTLFDAHEMFVASIETDNNLSRRVDRLFERKYGKMTAGFHDLDEKEFMICWKNAFKSGEYQAEFWAAVSRPDLSDASKKQIFGTIHMAMHVQGETLSRMKKQMSCLAERVRTQDQKMKELLTSRRTLAKENERLKRNEAEMEKTFRFKESELNRLKCTHADPGICLRLAELESANERLTRVLSEKEAAVKDKNMKLAQYTSRLEGLTQELERWKKTESEFRKEAEDTLCRFSAMNTCDELCPAFDLCRKRVLIVGGIERMESLYRQIVEGSGGVFDYHNGHMKGGGKHLENRLKRSDIVLCPVNCNSHAACALVKNLGKKHNKPVHMLSSFSLSTVSQVIRTCGNGEAA